jgi:PEP-CTERM motif
MLEEIISKRQGERVEKTGKSQNTCAGERIALWSMILVGLVAAYLLLEPRRADATLTLQVGSGSAAEFCSDGESCDVNSAPGAVTYVGVGAWSFSVSTAATYSTPGSPALVLPVLHFSTSYFSMGPGNIYVAATQNGYAGPYSGNYLLSVGGVTSGTVGVQAFVNSALLGSLGPMSGGAFSGTVGGPVEIAGPYSLTVATTITQSGPGFSSLDVGLSLPEPASLILLGSGLLVLGLANRRRKSERELDGYL